MATSMFCTKPFCLMLRRTSWYQRWRDLGASDQEALAMLAGRSPCIEQVPWCFGALQGHNALQGHGALQLPQFAQSAKSSTSEATGGEHGGIWWPSMCANWIARSSDDWSDALLCRCKALIPVVSEGRSLDITHPWRVRDL